MTPTRNSARARLHSQPQAAIPLLVLNLAQAMVLAMAGATGGCGDDGGDRDDGVADELGAPCVRISDCSESLCGASDDSWPVEDLDVPALMCGESRGPGEAGDACEQPGDCARGLCALAGACILPCQGADDCGPTARCQEVYVRGLDPFLHPTPGCVDRVTLPADTVVESELRVDALDGLGGGGEAGGTKQTLALPAADRPTLIALEHLGTDTWPGVRCRAPVCVDELRSLMDGSVLYSRAALEMAMDVDGPRPVNPVSRDHTVQPALIYLGNGPVAPWSELGYEVDVQSEQPGDLRVTRIARSPTPSGGRLDLNVFYVGVEGWQPEGARGNQTLDAALERVDQIFEPAGIFIGEVRQIQVTGTLPERGRFFDNPDNPNAGFAELSDFAGTWLELPALLRLSAGAANIAVNVFFVQSIAPAGQVPGLSGGNPGAMGMHGTGASGIVLATSVEGGADALGRTLAHELAHFLGLFHTSEVNEQVWDPTTDVVDERDNLMFATTQHGGVQLSEQQRVILRQAPVLQ